MRVLFKEENFKIGTKVYPDKECEYFKNLITVEGINEDVDYGIISKYYSGVDFYLKSNKKLIKVNWYINDSEDIVDTYIFELEELPKFCFVDSVLSQLELEF